MMEDAQETVKGVPFKVLVERFRQKVSMIPEECHEAIMYWQRASRIQEVRISVNNQLSQVIKIEKQVFWADREIPDQLKGLYGAGAAESERKGKKVSHLKALELQEAELVRKCDKAFESTRWYQEVVKAAAEGAPIGPMTAGNLLWIIGSAKRFPTFGRLVRYAGLDVTPEGKAPKRRKGEKVVKNIRLQRTLFVLTEVWNKDIDKDKETGEIRRIGVWRERWDNWKMVYRLTRPEILAEVSKEGKPCGEGHIHNMARRKVQREFLRNLYYLWCEFEGFTPAGVNESIVAKRANATPLG